MNRNKSGQAAPKAATKQKVNMQKNPQARMAKQPSSMRQQSAAAAYATGQSTGKAAISRMSVDSCRIRHRELVASITGSAAFTVASNFSINPGLPASFPWLSVEAQGWEKYRFESLKLCYYTRTGTNVPGSLLLAADYDAADAAPATEQIASAYFGTQEDAPWKDICFTFDRNRLAGDRFIRVGGLAPNLDVKTYDVANAFVCTTDGTAVSWGKIWLEYDVVLMNPQLPPGGPSGSATLAAGGSVISAATPFGSVPVALGSYALTGAATNVLTMNGLSIGTEYSVLAASVGTAITAYSFTGFAGATAKVIVFQGFPVAATSAASCLTFTATANTVTVTLVVTATTITSTDVILTALTPAPSF